VLLAPALAGQAPENRPALTPARRQPRSGIGKAAQPPVYRRYRISFAKQGDARFMSHRQVMDTIERALRCMRAPVRFTEGFNPHIRLSMGPALATGHEGLAEVFDIDCTAPLRRHVLEAANQLLPAGLELYEARDLLPAAPSIGKLVAAARYRLEPRHDQPWPEDPQSLPQQYREAVLSWMVLPDGSLRLELNLREQEGPVGSIKEMLLALGVAKQDVPVVRVVRELLLLRPARARSPKPRPASGRAGKR
jgi:radical SAM-linked protein